MGENMQKCSRRCRGPLTNSTSRFAQFMHLVMETSGLKIYTMEIAQHKLTIFETPSDGFRPGRCPEIPEILKFVLRCPEIGVRS